MSQFTRFNTAQQFNLASTLNRYHRAFAAYNYPPALAQLAHVFGAFKHYGFSAQRVRAAARSLAPYIRPYNVVMPPTRRRRPLSPRNTAMFIFGIALLIASLLALSASAFGQTPPAKPKVVWQVCSKIAGLPVCDGSEWQTKHGFQPKPGAKVTLVPAPQLRRPAKVQDCLPTESCDLTGIPAIEFLP